MSNRFVRVSSYRHVHGDPAKKEGQFLDVRPLAVGDGDYITGNSKYFALPYVGGGGPVLVQKLDAPGRVLATAPKVSVHKANVLDVAFNPFNDEVLATASEDCYACVVAFDEGGPKENISKANATLHGHTKKVISVDWHPVANNILATASADHTVKVWDVEKQVDVATREHGDFVTHLAWNTNGGLMGTTCKDKTNRVFDIRTAETVAEFKGCPGTKKSTFHFIDNHELYLSCGFSKTAQRQYKIWDPRKLDKALATKDLGGGSGVMSVHYDPDNSILYIGGKGDSSIKYFEIVKEAPYLHFLSEYRDSSSQKGLSFLPKRACDVKKCEIAKALRVMRDAIIPVSFQVPRKSDMFQKDIFPDAYAGVSALSADDWAGGANADPVLSSLEPGQETERAAVAFVAQKSPAELQAELNAANARIAELEAELAKLKA